MIELERDESQDIEVWADSDFSHVIVHETEDAPHGYGPAGWYVRDENVKEGPFRTLEVALYAALAQWGSAVTLAPANRLRAAIDVEDENDVGTYLLEYLATYGTAGIDAQTLARRVFERLENS